MCLTCEVEGKILVTNILPGYFLEVATKPGYEDQWPQGYLALVRMNDPDYVWPFEPLLDPEYDEDDEKEEEDTPAATEKAQAMMRFAVYSESVQDNFVSDPMQAYRFVEACKAAGYDPDRDGYNTVHWFLAYVNRKIFSLGLEKDLTGSIDMVK